MATGIPTSMPVFELWLWSVGFGEGELEDVWDEVAEVCVDVGDVATGVWLVACKEVLRLEEADGSDVGVVTEEILFVDVVLDDVEDSVTVD